MTTFEEVYAASYGSGARAAVAYLHAAWPEGFQRYARGGRIDWDAAMRDAQGFLSGGESRAVRVSLSLLNDMNDVNISDFADDAEALAVVVQYITQGRLTVAATV